MVEQYKIHYLIGRAMPTGTYEILCYGDSGKQSIPMWQ